jgi:phosphoglycerate dehydrogenase-like enzyme
MDELLKESDFVVLLVPLSKDTTKLLGKREFSLMKKTSTLVNIARGGVIDQNALVEALENGVIGKHW